MHAQLCQTVPMCQAEQQFRNCIVMRMWQKSFKNRYSALTPDKLHCYTLKIFVETNLQEILEVMSRHLLQL